MENEVYLIGNNKNEILLTVTISSTGFVVTDVLLSINGQNLLKGHSTDGTGFIGKAKIGNAENLNYGLIVIETDILLNKIPKEEWDECFDNLKIKYYFEGGKSGQTQPYLLKDNEKHADNSGSIIIAKKYITLKI